MALVEFAREELSRIGSGDPDEQTELSQDAMNAGILRIVEMFAEEGHSGFSASYAINILERLLRFEPLTPLTGEDSEWQEVGDGLFQNRRCSHVFMEGGRAYDIEGRIFCEPDGICFTNGDSRVPVTFPYTPTREYVDVPQVSA